MTDTNFGLNRNAINQNFPTNTGGAQTVYADRNYVQGEITNRLSSQDLNITFGPGLTTSSNTSFTGKAQTVINVGICSSLGDLSDVLINAPAKDQILVYSGTCWVNSDGASIAKIEDLPFVYKPAAATLGNAFLKTNNTGTCTIFVPGDFIEEVNVTEGCKKTGTATIPAIGTDLTTIPNTNNDDDTNFFIVTSKQGTANYSQRKIEKKNIKLGNFDNDKFLRTDGLSINPINGTSPAALIGTSTGTSTLTLTLDLSGYFEKNDGNLHISQGGTSANTAEGARANLGLSIGNADSVWNKGQLAPPFIYPDLPNTGGPNLLPSLGTSPGLCVVGFGTCHQPGFYKKLVGSDIRIVSAGVSSISIGTSNGMPFGTSGSGYDTSGTSGFIKLTKQALDGNNPEIRVGVSYTVSPSGSLETISLADENVGFPYLNVNGTKIIVEPDDSKTPTTNALVDLTLFDSYINFGASVRENGVGFRFVPGDGHTGKLFVNNGTCSSSLREGWETINQPPIENLEGVCITSSVTPAEFLIYNGTCWRNKPITGGLTIDEDGVTSFEGISPQTIGVCSWANPITTADFSTLDGIYPYLTDDTNLGVSRIKDALAKKYTIDHTHHTQEGSIFFVNNPGSCVLTPLKPTLNNDVLASMGSSAIPQYTNVANTFLDKSSQSVSSNSLICLADMTTTPSVSIAALYDKTNFNKYITGSDPGSLGGLGVCGNGDLVVTTTNTETMTEVVGNTNTLLIGTSFPSGGLEPVKNILISDFVNSAAISSTLQVGASPPNLTNHPDFSTGEAAFFTSKHSGSGTSFFAVYNGNSWYGVELNTLIWP